MSAAVGISRLIDLFRSNYKQALHRKISKCKSSKFIDRIVIEPTRYTMSRKLLPVFYWTGKEELGLWRGPCFVLFSHSHRHDIITRNANEIERQHDFSGSRTGRPTVFFIKIEGNGSVSDLSRTGYHHQQSNARRARPGAPSSDWLCFAVGSLDRIRLPTSSSTHCKSLLDHVQHSPRQCERTQLKIFLLIRHTCDCHPDGLQNRKFENDASWTGRKWHFKAKLFSLFLDFHIWPHKNMLHFD